VSGASRVTKGLFAIRTVGKKGEMGLGAGNGPGKTSRLQGY